VLLSPTGSNLGSENWQKMIILSEKIWVSGLKKFKLLIKTKEISTNDCAFFKFVLLLGEATVTNCPKRQKT
jgi:hypothetical protein